MRSSSNTRRAATWRLAEQHVGVHEREVADEDRRALAEPARLAAPAPLPRASRSPTCGSRGALGAWLGAVHHVVVDERERVQQLERRAGVDDPAVRRITTRADERPVTERGPQSLASGEHEPAERDQGLFDGGVDGAPSLDLAVEQRDDARLGAATDLGQTRRNTRSVVASVAPQDGRRPP